MLITIYKQVERTIRKYGMVERGDKVLVGVSGGPDSIFLLEALNYLKKQLCINIIAATLDHGIRGRRSAADSRFVVMAAKKLKVRCITKKIKLSKSELRGTLSIEELLREKRYDFFKSAAKKAGADILATGHTLDDQAETVLMRVLKGTTIKGLAGIAPVGEHGKLSVIRPLIEIEKQPIVEFLRASKIRYRTDHTNRQERYLRNKIRKHALPYLEKYNPRLKRTLALMAESLREDKEFIEGEKKKQSHIKKNKKYVSIKLKDIVVQPESLRREILRDAMISSGASVKKLTFRHWQEMKDFLKYKRRGKSIDLPGGIMLKREAKEILFKKR